MAEGVAEGTDPGWSPRCRAVPAGTRRCRRSVGEALGCEGLLRCPYDLFKC